MDRRDRMALEGGNEKPVLFFVDDDGNDCERTLPTKFDVCPTCEGRGSHVNPAIDAHGISADEFNEDPGFREEYFSGVYDVGCYECGGNRVIYVVDEDACSKETLEAYRRQLQDEADDRAMRDAEMRYGA